MSEGFDPRAFLAAWEQGQQAFWSAAADGPGFCDAAAFAEPDWQPFDNLMAHILSLPCGAPLSDDHQASWIAATAASGQYRDVILATFARIREAFDVQRRAFSGTDAAFDWRLLRARWFAIAEAEFIRTLRSEDFLHAQVDVVHTGLALWNNLPASAREEAVMGRRLSSAGRQTGARIGASLADIAGTPKDVVWQAGQVTLSRYRPIAPRVEGLPPLLICHGLIGRQTMIDLRPDRSMVRQLLAAGADVFVIDWGNAGPEATELGLDHYVGEMLPRLVQATTEVSEAPQVTLFGICQGGTLAACHAALDPTCLAGLITAVAPFDFHADPLDADPAHGLLNLWTRALPAEDVRGLIAMEGNLSGELLGAMFHQLNPIRTLSKYSVHMLEAASDPGEFRLFLGMEAWLADRPDLPGGLADDWLIGLYQENRLAHGTLTIKGRAVDLGALQLPVLNIFATQDHIIPPPCARALGTLAPNAPYQELALPTGHIGAFVSAAGQPLLAPCIMRWLTA